MAAENVRLVQRLLEKGLQITTAESCTGGLVAALITDVPGSSAVFRRGFVTYCDEAKHEMLGVSNDLLQQYSAVSQPVAEAMARGAARESGADVAISITGIAGPDGGDEIKPVGTVFIGLYVQGMVIVEQHVFAGDRRDVRRAAAERAVHAILELL